jgi:uncharacterized protein YjiS (DUF1127 family)
MASHVIDIIGSSLCARLWQGWRRLRERFTDRRATNAKRRQIARELAAHNDRELFDLGITRANIPQILDGTFSRG